MKKYKQWNREENKWETIEVEEVNYGKSRTDTSKYRPNVNRLTGAEGANDIKGEFDFSDGKDDGSKNYLLRNKGLDIVELQERAENIMNTAKEITEEMRKTIELEQLKEAQNNTGMEDGAPRNE